MPQLTQDTVFGWLRTAIDDSIGIEATKTTRFSTVLDACKRFEEQSGHKGRMTKALYFGINDQAWKAGQYYFSAFELADMRNGPKGADGARVPFTTCGALASYLRDNAAQI